MRATGESCNNDGMQLTGTAGSAVSTRNNFGSQDIHAQLSKRAVSDSNNLFFSFPQLQGHAFLHGLYE